MNLIRGGTRMYGKSFFHKKIKEIASKYDITVSDTVKLYYALQGNSLETWLIMEDLLENNPQLSVEDLIMAIKLVEPKRERR